MANNDELEVQNLKHWSEHYYNENQKIERRLKQMGMADLLREDAQASLNALTNIAFKLKLDKVVDETRLLVALTNYVTQKNDEDLKILNLKQQIRRRNEKLLEVNMRIENLLKDSEYIEATIDDEKRVADEMKATIEFTDKKFDDYEKKLQVFQNANHSIDETLKHDALVKTYNEFKRIEQSISNIESSFEKYKWLPPSKELAKIELLRLKNEIKAIDEEINSYMTSGFL
jgi:hypothetical protein